MLTGRREPMRDRFDSDYADWSYSFRGRTIDQRDIRVIVAIEGEELEAVLLVSAYDASRKGK